MTIVYRHPALLIRSFERTAVLLSLLLVFPALSRAQDDTTTPLVLTAMAPVYHLTAPLLENTTIELQLVPEAPRTMAAQTTVFTRQAERYAELFRRADAVITIGKLWTSDPFYIAAREVNIRVVNIDASKPWSHELNGVAVAEVPGTATVSPYFWLSLSNVIRMLDIIGADLQRLYPDAQAVIRQNLQQQKASYGQMKNNFEQAFIKVDDPVVYALADEFVYFTRDLGIFVDAYQVKQDIDWTEADLTVLGEALDASGIEVVIHKWEPAEAIRQTVEDAGATLLVLDTLETTADFRAGLQQNLDALLAAFGVP